MVLQCRILMLSTSPHWEKNSQGKYHAMVQNVLSFLQRSFHGIKVFVRSSIPGHPNCEKAQGPYLEHSYRHEETWYNWDEFSDHNKMWKAGIDSLGDNRFAFFDVASMSALRPDGHLDPPRDCLHYCLPGLIDHWNFLLMAHIMSVLS